MFLIATTVEVLGQNQPDSRGQAAWNGLQLQKLDQQSYRNDGGRLRHDRSEYCENWRGCGDAQQGEGEAEQHSYHADDEAEDGELTSMRGPLK
jgi:hypothetical protein